MRKQIVKSIKKITKKLLFPIPSHLSKNFLKIDLDKLQLIEKSIRENYHVEWRSECNYSREKYQADLEAHLYGRIENDRETIIPWIANTTNLQDKRILEIGCGTGSSSVAIAEQGAVVTGTDIDEGALTVAKDRSRVYGINATFRYLNAQDISNTYNPNSFDIIIFFACLEHMTISERLISLRGAWDLLPTDGLLVIVETPNRLWYFDGHTSMLRFFHGLPNELAFAYSKFSPRENFHELYHEYNKSLKEHFLRRGRGMSFHEIDISIKPARDLNIISSLSEFQGAWYNLQKSRLERRYKSLLMKIYPNLHEGFFDNFLYLIIKKN